MTHDIEDETGIIRDVVAEKVTEEAASLLESPLTPETVQYLVGYLTGHAAATYEASASFRKKINARGNKGRDALYTYMRHWASAELVKANQHDPNVRRVLEQSGFSIGHF
jgi:hypothetical protein